MNSGRAGRVCRYSASAPNEPEPASVATRTNPASSRKKPMCIMMRYESAARRTSRRSASKRMSRNDATVISSQKKRNE